MINGLGVLGWGAGGIEAEAAMLGQPMFMPQPLVIGVRTIGSLPPGTTATDLVLTLTEMLRAHGVVGRFIEFFGDGLSTLSTADRATLSNMCPEYGATAAYFPVDAETLRYLSFTGRGDLVDVVGRYTKARACSAPTGTPIPSSRRCSTWTSMRWSRRWQGRSAQDRVALPDMWSSFTSVFGDRRAEQAHELRDGSVVIAAITSCTNTSNPSVMMAAGLLAKKAVEAGLQTKPWVKSSLAPARVW